MTAPSTPKPNRYDPEPPLEELLPQVELISEDGVPLESDWHRIEINLLIELVHQHYAGRTDYYVGGNMFIYFSEEQARNRDYRGPDFFFVRGVAAEPMRDYWAAWKEEGRYPDAIIELLSPTTAKEDRTTKKALYERTFRTPDYFCYDTSERTLEGWHRAETYQPLMPDERGWLWSEQLGLWLGTWEGVHMGHHATWLRFYTPEGQLVPTAAEAERQRTEAERQRADAERQRAAVERQRATLEAQRAEAERQRATLEAQRAEAERLQAAAERQRAEAAEAELARLRAELEALRRGEQGA